ncbi:MAG TPA: desulfoferrodoxin [Clostridiales bacterium]|nr:desulfoferrodoxin [Clostridiales bacterium]
MCESRFFICRHCGNFVEMIHSSGVNMICCGEEMTELTANTVEASAEKHLPVVTVTGDKVHVAVGSVAHPMVEKHYIQWIYLKTDKGVQRKCLLPDNTPEAAFALVDETPLAAYEYCNLHGLWKTEI